MSEQVFGCRRLTKASSLPYHPSHHPTIHPSIPKRAFTCLPGCTRVSVSPTQCRVLIYCVARRLCLCETAFTRRSFTRSRASLLVHHRQCALVNVRKVYEIYADGHNLVNVWKMGNRRCPAARSRVIHCGPKAPQGAHPLIL